MIQTTARTPKRRAASQAGRKASDRDKCTLLLDRDTSIKLTVAAHLRGLDRSELVNELLTAAAATGLPAGVGSRPLPRAARRGRGGMR